jgi:type II secretory pathway component PulJ
MMPPRPLAGSRGRRGAAFTLLEMLIVMTFTAMLLAAAVNSYLQLSNASRGAADSTRVERRATTLLDRVARDLEGAVLLVRPDDVDPLAHPWLFLAESRRGTEGADRLKFDTRSHVPRATARHESDLAVVSYFLEPGDEHGDLLYRALRAGLPEQLDRRFPAPGDEGVELFADDVFEFGVRLLDDAGQWTGAWDSSTLERSSQLPLAAEIRISLLTGEDGEVSSPRLRRVFLPVRPFDLAEELAQAAESADEEKEDEEEDGENADCVTVNQCIALNPDTFDLLLRTNPDLGPVVESLGEQCFSAHAAALGVQVEGCE